MKKLYDLSVAVGSYKDAQGNDKTRWENIGVMCENDKGKPFILLKATFNPAGVGRPDGMSSVMVSVFPADRERNLRSSDDAEIAQASNFGESFENPPF